MIEFAAIRSTLREATMNGLDIEKKAWRRNLPPPNKIHSGWESYYETFRGVELESLPSVFRKIRLNHLNEQIATLDIMGNGDVYRSLPYDLRPDHIFAITLIDDRTNEQKVDDENHGIHIMKGNVALPSTWRKLAKRMREVNITSLQHAFARPLNGIYSIPTVDWLIWYIGQQVYSLLDSQDGIFLTEAPEIPEDIDILSWAKNAKSYNLDVRATMIGPGQDKTNFLPPRPIVRIVRHSNSPNTLPKYASK